MFELLSLYYGSFVLVNHRLVFIEISKVDRTRCTNALVHSVDYTDPNFELVLFVVYVSTAQTFMKSLFLLVFVFFTGLLITPFNSFICLVVQLDLSFLHLAGLLIFA